MQLTTPNARLIGQLDVLNGRAATGLILNELRSSLTFDVVGADTSTSGGLERFRRNFPESYIEVGISEQHMINVASAFALNGVKVVTLTFAPFIALRAAEQIKINASYMDAPIIMIGFGAGLALSQLGYTHACIEDVGVIQSMPNIQVISPSNNLQIYHTLSYLLSQELREIPPTYIRLTHESRAKWSELDNIFRPFIVHRRGPDAVVFATGSSVKLLFEIASLSEAIGKEITLIELVHLAPHGDLNGLLTGLKCPLAVSIDESLANSGCHRVVSELIITNDSSIRHIQIFAPAYPSTGPTSEVLAECGFVGSSIIERMFK